MMPPKTQKLSIVLSLGASHHPLSIRIGRGGVRVAV